MSPRSRSFYGCPGIKQLATNRKKSHSGSLKRGLNSAASTQLALFTGEMPTWDHTAFEGVDRDDKPPYNELKKVTGCSVCLAVELMTLLNLCPPPPPRKKTNCSHCRCKKNKTICDTHKDSTFLQRMDYPPPHTHLHTESNNACCLLTKCRGAFEHKQGGIFPRYPWRMVFNSDSCTLPWIHNSSGGVNDVGVGGGKGCC